MVVYDLMNTPFIPALTGFYFLFDRIISRLNGKINEIEIKFRNDFPLKFLKPISTCNTF